MTTGGCRVTLSAIHPEIEPVRSASAAGILCFGIRWPQKQAHSQRPDCPSLYNLTNLTNVLTAGTLRMSDADRLQAIDHIYEDTNGKLIFLRHFDTEVQILQVQRQKEQNDVNTLQKLYP